LQQEQEGDGSESNQEVPTGTEATNENDSNQEVFNENNVEHEVTNENAETSNQEEANVGSDNQEVVNENNTDAENTNQEEASENTEEGEAAGSENVTEKPEDEPEVAALAVVPDAGESNNNEVPTEGQIVTTKKSDGGANQVINELFSITVDLH
jgi:hypothetical protein